MCLRLDIDKPKNLYTLDVFKAFIECRARRKGFFSAGIDL